MTTILWNLDTDDWAAGTTETVSAVQQHYDDFIAMGSNGTFNQNGNIVLTHEINNMTMDLAVKNLPKITKSYKNVMDVATCMNITYPYQETTVKFPSFSDYVAGNKGNTVGSNSTSSSGAASGAASGSASGSASAAKQSSSTSAGFKTVPVNGLAFAAVLTFAAALI